MDKFKELSSKELLEINGGQVKYFEYSWSGTSNPLRYFAEAVGNIGAAVANAGIWVWNQFVD